MSRDAIAKRETSRITKIGSCVTRVWIDPNILLRYFEFLHYVLFHFNRFVVRRLHRVNMPAGQDNEWRFVLDPQLCALVRSPGAYLTYPGRVSRTGPQNQNE